MVIGDGEEEQREKKGQHLVDSDEFQVIFW
jgi:hypothetical protein